jgi:hypothetical protein
LPSAAVVTEATAIALQRVEAWDTRKLGDERERSTPEASKGEWIIATAIVLTAFVGKVSAL